MNIKENISIPVYNYNECYVFIPTEMMTHTLEPCRENIPTVDHLSASEILYVNGISDCFRTGLVQFADEDKEEIFTELLKFSEWKSILTNKDIEDLLLNPTMEGLQEIIDIRNPSVFDRIRSIFTRIKENYEDDLSNRVIKIIEARYLEFKRGILKSAIEIKLKDTKKAETSAEEINAIKEQNVILMAQLEEMKKMIMIQTKTPVEEKEIKEPVVPEEKNGGRQPKKK